MTIGTHAYEATTHGVRVSVQPFYLEEESDPEEGQFFWAYQVQIENLGDETVQLKSRYWRITDSLGRTEEVHGDGVVGEQPMIDPGYVFEYTSGAPLTTASGFMGGSYEMHKNDGSAFEVEIPSFSLDSPYSSHTVN
ncbi:Co2+/Mg2+ efflux protein ApaG [Paremcibacter congregatus]|mgnify:CR=1 FL=1|uniref:Protein ApaG n=2 Tax=Paremcibacter congregatus TaxID=2043170 RepID=A0A2G4YVI8_9PROT|nr:Co2+/Mg2+ efflux protein ApaG [Paremcibacter congregatus]QDE29190.1 Co2+/Mg2+ efflux protein ApaG [Paremcibacter congregatus]